MNCPTHLFSSHHNYSRGERAQVIQAWRSKGADSQVSKGPLLWYQHPSEIPVSCPSGSVSFPSSSVMLTHKLQYLGSYSGAGGADLAL